MAEPLQQEETQDIGADPMDDTIRQAWEGMQGDGEIGSEEAGEAAIGQERDESGRFVGKATEGEQTAEGNAEGEQAEQEGEQTEGEQEGEEETTDDPYVTPPNSWKKEAAEGWKDIPAHVRQEIHRREQNFLDGIQQYKGAAEFGQSLYKEFQPYEPLMRSLNTNPQEAVKVMLNQEYVLRQGTPEQKGELIAEAIKTYGIDPNKIRLDGGQQTSEVPPEIQQYLAPFQQKVQQLEQALNQQQSQAQQATEAASRAQQVEVTNEVESFRTSVDDSGKLAYPYFDQVRHDMGALIKEGRATDLKDAYDKATWANPEVRAKLIAAQRKTEREAAAKKAADAKRAAAANVETQGTPPGKEAAGTMDDTIRATAEKLGLGSR